jgi:hypothetical protein
VKQQRNFLPPVRKRKPIPLITMKMKNTNATNTNLSKTEELGYTLQESADLLSFSDIPAWRLIQRGKIRCKSSIQHKRIPGTEFKRFIKGDLN